MSISHNTTLLVSAATRGDANEVQRLIPLSNPKANHSEALQIAAYHGHVACVALLIPVSCSKNGLALEMAARSGHVDCVELLIPVSNSTVNENSALRLAAAFGHASCVELLIPVSDPKAEESWALTIAVEEGHFQCVELLYPVSDPVVVFNNLQKYYPNTPDKWMVLERMIEAERLNTVLNKEIRDQNDQPNGFKVQRKI